MSSEESSRERFKSHGREAAGRPAHCSLPPASGRLGPFVFVRQLGTGGFAPVWLAEEGYQGTVLRRAAVKLFALRVEERPIHRSVLAEASALCRVEHPNVVRFYSLAMDQASEGLIGLAMEYVDGEPLAQQLHERSRLSVAETVRVGLAIASALSAVHRVGLVHRDLKPANVIDSEGVCKLIDFGLATAESAIAWERKPLYPLHECESRTPGKRLSSYGGLRIVDEDCSARTVTLATKCGTIGYIDPICMATGVPAVAASDLYALGVILFECLVGSLPSAIEFAALATRAERGDRLKSDVLLGRERAPSVASLIPDVPQAFAALIDSLLDPRRSSRPPSAASVVEQLERVHFLVEARQRLAPSEARRRSAEQSQPEPRSGKWTPSGQPPEPDRCLQSAPLVYDGVALLARGNALLVVYQAPARFHRTRWIFDCADRLARDQPGGLVCLMVVLPTADPPDAHTRAENARRFKKLGEALRAMVTVPTGDSLWLSLVRSVMRGISAAQGTSNKFIVCDRLDQGITRLVVAARSSAVQRRQIEGDVQALCTALDVGCPPLRG